MILQKELNSNFKNILFNKNKLITIKHTPQLNISEELLTYRTLVVTALPITQSTELDLLQKMFAGCKLHQGAYHNESAEKGWGYFRTQAHIKEVILFGVSESDFNISVVFPFNKPTMFDNKIWIKTVDLGSLLQRQDLKNILWQQALKPHYIN